jgi:hypothetical protein
MLPIVILTVATEYALRKIPNTYSYKKSYLDKYSEEIEILIFGASQMFNGIDPIYFSVNTFNACHDSQSYDIDFEIFKKYQNKLSKLRLIIMHISYRSLRYKLSADNRVNKKMKNYVLYYGIKIKHSRNNLAIAQNPISNLRKLYKYYFKEENNINCTPLGRGEAVPKVVDLESHGKKRAIAHTPKTGGITTDIFMENIAILDAFIEFCNQNNVVLLFITTPTYSSYRQNLNTEQLNEMFETIDGLTQEHNNVLYANWLEDSSFTAEDYVDSDHLNQNGAKKLSIKLASYIDSLGIIGKR